jgi:hypothetical protein
MYDSVGAVLKTGRKTGTKKKITDLKQVNGWKMTKPFSIPVSVFHVPFSPVSVYIPQIRQKAGMGAGISFSALLAWQSGWPKVVPPMS